MAKRTSKGRGKGKGRSTGAARGARRGRSSPAASGGLVSRLRAWAGSIDWAGPRRAATAAAWLVGLGGLAAAWAVGVPKLEARAAATATTGEERGDDGVAVDVRFVELPRWVGPDLHTMLVLTARESLSADPFDQRSLAAARRGLLETGWLDAVDQVRRLRADLVEVEATFVTPFAVVREGSYDWIIDPTGRLLPRSGPAGAAPQFVAITGPARPRPDGPGGQWPGEDVTAALRLLRLIDDRPWRDQIVEIDVAGYERTRRLSLLTDTGCRIVWGAAPGEETPLELLAEGKLERLEYLYRHHRRVDGGHAGEIDITDPKAAVKR